jgi:hypothetical protein
MFRWHKAQISVFLSGTTNLPVIGLPAESC